MDKKKKKKKKRELILGELWLNSSVKQSQDTIVSLFQKDKLYPKHAATVRTCN